MIVNELSLSQAWTMLRDEQTAVLVDVRTTAEWAYVGVPDLAELGKKPRLVEWVRYPDGAPNKDFCDEASEGLTKDQPILLLCRSGARSAAAAHALQEAGYTKTFNIVAGFEGNVGSSGHREGGWKDQLSWIQK